MTGAHCGRCKCDFNTIELFEFHSDYCQQIEELTEERDAMQKCLEDNCGCDQTNEGSYECDGCKLLRELGLR